MSLQNNFCWRKSKDIKEICQPLFQALNLSYFDYAHCYPDGSVMYFCTNQDWFTHGFEEKYAFAPFTIPEGSYAWQDIFEERIIRSSKAFNHKNQMMHIKSHDEYVECFDFGMSVDSKINSGISFYHKQKELLDAFLLYFKDKAAGLINKAESQRIELVDEMLAQKTVHKLENSARLDFLDAMRLKQYRLKIKGGYGTITHKEMQCFGLFSQDLSAKDIANSLNISHRTVEKHLEHVRRKLNCADRKQLRHVARKNLIY